MSAPRVTVSEHPLLQQYLTVLRDRRTDPEQFKRVLTKASLLLGYEATRSLETKAVTVTTPLRRTGGRVLRREVILVPVLRAGLGMLPGFLELLPRARVGFVGMKRNEKTLRPAAYLESLPSNLSRFDIMVLDPMLATAGSAMATLKLLQQRRARRLRLVNVVSSIPGIRRVNEAFSDVPIFTATVDPTLNRRGFIVPGLGDAGDRLFGV